MQHDAEIIAELERLDEQQEALRMIERVYRNLSGARRHEADLLAHVANGLNDPHGRARNHVERIRDFVRQIIRDELTRIEART